MREEDVKQGFLMPTPAERMGALTAKLKQFETGELQKPEPTDFVNNHIHTIYSFSPYSPTGAAYTAWASGLSTAGIMDHDSIAGAREFTEAAARLNIGATCGFECRVKLEGTPFYGRRTNSPDQTTIAYLTCHGVPHQNIEKAQQWLQPVRAARNARNTQMVDNINGLLRGSGVELSFENDVAPLSQSAQGGSITERHLLYALAFRVTAAVGRGQPVLDFLNRRLGIEVDGKLRENLLDAVREDYEYVLLGVFKSSLVGKFYVDAWDECYPLADFVAFATSIGAMPVYPYLGDVTDSVTGDKKAQTFEDAYLDELIPWLAQNGFVAVTYMPTRNTPLQLQRLEKLCRENKLFQISGEDINTPAQSFVCQALTLPENKHLVASTWALIGHEAAASQNVEDGMFTPKTLAAMPTLAERIRHFEAIGRATVK